MKKNRFTGFTVYHPGIPPRHSRQLAIGMLKPCTSTVAGASRSSEALLAFGRIWWRSTTGSALSYATDDGDGTRYYYYFRPRLRNIGVFFYCRPNHVSGAIHHRTGRWTECTLNVRAPRSRGRDRRWSWRPGATLESEESDCEKARAAA